MVKFTWGSVLGVLGGIVFIISTSFGVNAYFAKDAEVKTMKAEIHENIKLVDYKVQALDKAFQYDQKENQISTKQERIYKINDRLLQRISPQERQQLEQLKRDLQRDIDKLKTDQEKLSK